MHLKILLILVICKLVAGYDCPANEVQLPCKFKQVFSPGIPILPTRNDIELNLELDLVTGSHSMSAVCPHIAFGVYWFSYTPIDYQVSPQLAITDEVTTSLDASKAFENWNSKFNTSSNFCLREGYQKSLIVSNKNYPFSVVDRCSAKISTPVFTYPYLTRLQKPDNSTVFIRVDQPGKTTFTGQLELAYATPYNPWSYQFKYMVNAISITIRIVFVLNVEIVSNPKQYNIKDLAFRLDAEKKLKVTASITAVDGFVILHDTCKSVDSEFPISVSLTGVTPVYEVLIRSIDVRDHYLGKIAMQCQQQVCTSASCEDKGIAYFLWKVDTKNTEFEGVTKFRVVSGQYGGTPSEPFTYIKASWDDQLGIASIAFTTQEQVKGYSAQIDDMVLCSLQAEEKCFNVVEDGVLTNSQLVTGASVKIYNSGDMAKFNFPLASTGFSLVFAAIRPYGQLWSLKAKIKFNPLKLRNINSDEEAKIEQSWIAKQISIIPSSPSSSRMSTGAWIGISVGIAGGFFGFVTLAAVVIVVLAKRIPKRTYNSLS